MDYVPRLRSELNLSLEVESRVIEILNIVLSNNFNGGNNPIGMAAASIYIAGQELGEKNLKGLFQKQQTSVKSL